VVPAVGASGIAGDARAASPASRCHGGSGAIFMPNEPERITGPAALGTASGGGLHRAPACELSRGS